MSVYIDVVKLMEWIGVIAVVTTIVVVIAFVKSNYKITPIDRDVTISDDWFYNPENRRSEEKPMNFQEWFYDEDEYLIHLKEEEQRAS